MNLPGLPRAIVSPQKIVAYFKASWLIGHGFHVQAWGDLVVALKRHAGSHEVARIESSPFGHATG